MGFPGQDAWKVRAFVQSSLYGHESPQRTRRSDLDATQGVLQNGTSQERKTGGRGCRRTAGLEEEFLTHVEARPRPLIENGRLNRKVMLREFMTCEEVRSQLRLHGIEDIAAVDHAYIEPNGVISVIRRDHEETEPVEPPEIL